MRTFLDSGLDVLDGLLAWFSSSMGQAGSSYCNLETADSRFDLVTKDGSLLSIVLIDGPTYLVGPEEFQKIQDSFSSLFSSTFKRPGHALQVYFSYDKEVVGRELNFMQQNAYATAEKLQLDLNDVFKERINVLKNYCASETLYFALWTHTTSLTAEQVQQSIQERTEDLKKIKLPLIRNTQQVLRAIPVIREVHTAFVRSLITTLNGLNIAHELLDVHSACQAMRNSVDPEFTAETWKARLPGDKLPLRETKNFKGEVADLLWPPLAQQLIPRDGEILDLRTCRIGDRLYSSVFIELLPQEPAPFIQLFQRLRETEIPWRISFLIEPNGLADISLKSALASFLTFAHDHNKLLVNAKELLQYLEVNTDDAIVKLRISTATWAPASQDPKNNLIRVRRAELAKSVQAWGFCETAEFCGDAYQAALASSLALNLDSPAQVTAAPMSEVTYMLPINRQSSPWRMGAVLFRTPDGKPWPYQPGSTLQTTWIDIVYARPGSGKSVLSNAMNLGLCLSGGLVRLPRIAIIDIGPSSSGLISLLKEALPPEKKHLVAYQRLRMRPEMSINPFDTQLGCRFPTPQERAFLVNFLILLATPIGQSRAYDGISDMAGLIVDEMYKQLNDDAKPQRYARDFNEIIDKAIQSAGLETDEHSTWWEISDGLFKAGHVHEAMLSQRYAMPILADAASICRGKAIEDLYGAISTPTGENLINAFGRMISSAIREYPVLSRPTAFDLGDARIVSLDLDEVAKSGGDAADRQTAVMYMLARYVLAKHYYLNEDNVKDMPLLYRDYHQKRVLEIREDPKRIVFDEFHRTSKAQAVRDQVIVDMREGRKWKVQVSLLSQSLDDFDPVMIEFATAIFIMDAGPQQAIEKSTRVFGLSPTATLALANRVHGPRPGGATFLAQFATKSGNNTQLITSTIGPIELWAFNTTAEDTRIRNALYQRIGAKAGRKILALLFPSGSAAKVVEERLNQKKTEGSVLTEDVSNSVIDTMIEEILEKYEALNLEQN
ncbi:MAG: type IV secretion protein IcmB [Gammaproteobacteria bacterium]